MKNIPTKKLNKKAYAPVLGLGTATLKGADIQNSLNWAFDAGYRHIDTADFYQNHKDIGKAIRGLGIKRDELFVTTKVWKTDLEENKVKDVLKRSLEEMKIDYVDLYLIHAPNDEVPVSETLGAMRELRKNGLINAIGVSNFNKQQIREIVDIQKHWKTEFKITNNQIEYHPRHRQDKLRKYCLDNKISVTAYSPLGSGKDINSETVKRLADKYNKSNSQIVLKWLVQKGMIVIPRSNTKEHIEENAQIFDWKMNNEDIKAMDNPPELAGSLG